MILANPVMIDAYRAGVPRNGKPFPNGSKMAEIHWKAEESAEIPLRRWCPTACMTLTSWRGTARDFRTVGVRQVPQRKGNGYRVRCRGHRDGTTDTIV